MTEFGKLPELYFRHKENGAAVFRIEAQNPGGALAFRSIGSINMRQKEFRPQNSATISDQELQKIDEWIVQQTELRSSLSFRRAAALPVELNYAADWVQRHASDDEFTQLTDTLLWAMFDLRQAIVRRHADMRKLMRDDSD